jgi:hypothetical protein
MSNQKYKMSDKIDTILCDIEGYFYLSFAS